MRMNFNKKDNLHSELSLIIKQNLNPLNIIDDHYPTAPELTNRMLYGDLSGMDYSINPDKHFAMAFESNLDSSSTSDESGNINELDLSGKTILIVEDDYANFLYLKRSLKRYKPNVLRARHGKEAVEMVRGKKEISLILMDMKMPIMNGYDATAAIKDISPLIPIIAQTAYVMEADKMKAFDAGCDDMLEKPITRDMLLDMLKKYLR